MGNTSGTESVDVTVEAPRAVLPGDSFDVVVGAPAVGGPVVAGEVSLIRRVAYSYRQFGPYGGSASLPADRTEVVDRQILSPGVVNPVGSVIGAVTVRVPVDALPTVSGELVRIAWRVTVRLNIPGAPDAVVSRTVRVLSAAADRAFVAREPARVEDRRTATLSFEELSSRRLTPGLALSGTLTAAPIKPVTVRAVRVELVLREQVHHGPWEGNDDASVIPEGQAKETETAVATATIATGLRMVSLHQHFPFTLAVPQSLPGPSLDTPEFTLKWLLRGVLDRVHRQDPFVELELQGATAPE